MQAHLRRRSEDGEAIRERRLKSRKDAIISGRLLARVGKSLRVDRPVLSCYVRGGGIASISKGGRHFAHSRCPRASSLATATAWLERGWSVAGEWLMGARALSQPAIRGSRCRILTLVPASKRTPLLLPITPLPAISTICRIMSPPDTDPAQVEPPLDSAAAPRKRTHPDDFKRAYKACINCRQRKAKCILDPAPGGELKPPCQRCKREMRECVFRSERSWVKRRKPGEARTQGEEAVASNDTSVTGDAKASSISTSQQSPVQRTPSISGLTHADTPHGRRSDIFSPPATLRRGSTSQPDLAHSVMRTVVSSGTDALNLLFEAANHRDAIENQDQNGSQPYETPRSAPSGYELGGYFPISNLKRDAFTICDQVLRKMYLPVRCY